MTLSLGLTAAQRAFRKNVLGGSDANIIMSGNSERILRLWREKRGEIEPENLDDVLPVQMGNATEPFNRYWFTRKTGIELCRAGEEALSFDFPWMAATLDGVTVEDNAAYYDAKHVNQFAKPSETLAKYTPQLHHNMIVLELNRAVLSTFFGTFNWQADWIDFDPMYGEALIAAETRFWDCVKSGEAPVAGPVIAAAVEAIKVVSFQGNNLWASNAADWLDNKKAAASFDTAAKELKGLVEPDVQEASGHGIIITRNKGGALSIKAAAKGKAK